MRRIIVVALREYRAAVQTRAFLVTLFLMPLLMFGSIILQTVFKDKVDITEKKFAIVDRTGKLYAGLSQALEQYNTQGIFKREEYEKPGTAQLKPKFHFEEVAPAPEEKRNEQLADLSDRVRKHELWGFVEIGSHVFSPDFNEIDREVRYFSNTPTQSDLPDWLGRVMNEQVGNHRLKALGLDVPTVRSAMSWVPLSNLELMSRDASGVIAPPKETNRFASFIIPFLLVMLMFMIISIGALPLMSSVLEEKMQRIAEVLLGSVRPFDLMTGKLMGSVGVSLTILAVYMIGGYFVAEKMGYGDKIPRELVGWFITYQALAILMFGSMFMAIGAATNDMKEAQSLLMPIWLIVCIPLFMLMPVIRDPSGTLATTMSFIPFSTPMIMMMRQAIPPGVPAWQPYVGVALCLVMTFFCVWAAGRVFRVGILLHGKPPKPAELIRWILKG